MQGLQQLNSLNTQKAPPVSKEEQEETEKWIAQRRKHFPSRQKLQNKQEVQALKEEKGALENLSKLEVKLRKKLRLITS